MVFRINQEQMDRYFAWLIAEGEQVFQPSSTKLVFLGFAIVIAFVLALAVIGYPIREVDETWQFGTR